MLLSVVAALGTHSRGALLGVVAMAIYMWLKNPRKLFFGSILLTVGIVLALFMPEQWFLRMETIENFQEDASAMGRINAWWTAYNVAKTHITGAGFDMYNATIFSLFAPDPTRIHAAHSIFFQVLGEHGFIGLFLFLGIWWSVWRVANSIIKDAINKPDFLWCSDLAKMSHVSLVGYAVGGAFICILTKRWIEENNNTKTSTSKDITSKFHHTASASIGTT
jgi:probable O-glycosylation ligase (exosortase A-associated)